MRRKRERKRETDNKDSNVKIVSVTSSPGANPIRGRSKRRCTGKELSNITFDACIEHMWGSLSKKKRDSFAKFDSIWFFMYLNACFKEKVLTWIKKMQIFSKRYVLVPIVCRGHWSLLIFCNFGKKMHAKSITPCMLLLDSLQTMEPRKQLESDIRKLVLDIFTTEERPDTIESIRKIPLLVPKVPQQINGEDCGRFVLYFISLFVEKAPVNFNMTKGYPYFMKENWFTHDSLEQFWKQFEKLEVQ